MSLGQRCDLIELRSLVVERLAVTQRVEQPDETCDEIDHVGAVGGSDLAQIGGGLPRNVRLRPLELARESREASAEGDAAEDVLVDESRDLVTRTAQAALGALERQRGLSRDELGEPGGLRPVGSSRTAPALAQLGQGCRFAGDDAAPVRVRRKTQRSPQPARIARIAKRDQVPQASHPNSSDLLGLPRDAQRGQQRVIGCGDAGLESRVEPRLAADVGAWGGSRARRRPRARRRRGRSRTIQPSRSRRSSRLEASSRKTTRRAPPRPGGRGQSGSSGKARVIGPRPPISPIVSSRRAESVADLSRP